MTTSEETFDAAVSRNYRHNFIVNLLDGALFFGGFAFLSEQTILPVFVSRLTDSPLALGLVSGMFSMGWLLPQVFTAPWVERLAVKKRFVATVSLFTERLAPFMMALIAWQALRVSPEVAVLLFLLALAYFSFGAGIIAAAWQDMIAKVIPVKSRGRFFGLTNFSGSLLGLGGALAAGVILARYPFPVNFALCFLVGALSILLSWFALLLTREPPLPDPRPPTSASQYFRGLPGLLRQDVNYRRYLITRAVGAFSNMGIGFIAVYAVQRFTLPDASAATFTAVVLVSQMVSNLVFGYLGDRYGHKLILELSMVAQALSFALALLAPSATWFIMIFALLGMTKAGLMLSGMAIAMELGPVHSRPTYIGLSNTVTGIVSGIAPLLGGVVVAKAGYASLFSIASVVAFANVLMWQWWVEEPRKRAVQYAGLIDEYKAADPGN